MASLALCLLGALMARLAAARDPIMDASLGTEHQELYTIAPKTSERPDKTVLVTSVWLRRIQLPNGTELVRGFMHSEDPSHALDLRVWPEEQDAFPEGSVWHMAAVRGTFVRTLLHHDVWLPSLFLEVEVTDEPQAFRLLELVASKAEGTAERRFEPYWFELTLPPKAGDCFRMYDKSTRGYKHSFCLLPNNRRLCDAMAPPKGGAPPSIWGVVPVLRNQGMAPDEWDMTYEDFAVRLRHHVTYHVAMGWAGMLVYADEVGMSYYEVSPLLRDLIAARQLLLVDWALMERRPMSTSGDGQYSEAGSEYDKPLIYAHALLGLAGCGTNLMLALTNIDQYFYAPEGNKWPEAVQCMRQAQSGKQATYSLPLLRVATPEATPESEAPLWGKNAAMGRGAAAELNAHPLSKYRWVYDTPEASESVAVATPGVRVVHSGVGRVVQADGDGREADVLPSVTVARECASMLWVPGMRQRGGTKRTVKTRDGKGTPPGYKALEHWLLRAE